MNDDIAPSPVSRRLFFALWPAAADAARIMQWANIAHQACGGRIMRPETLHLTLAFLGNTSAEKVITLQSAAAEWPAQARAITLERFGCFQGPRVVWAGPGAQGTHAQAWLQALHDDLWMRLEAMGWQRPDTAFRPHVSLLRKASTNQTAALSAPAPLTWLPEQCMLVASTPGENGSYYEVLARMRLHVSQ